MASKYFKLESTQTALAFLLPHHLQTEINSLRKIHDKAYRKWQPHINLIYPFVDPSVLSAAVSVLRETLTSNNEIVPIELNTNEVGTFKHRRNATVFLKPSAEPEEAVCELRRVLVKALGCSDDEGTRDGTYRPHMSIGQGGFQGNSLERLIQQVGRLANVEWNGTSLVVLRRQESGEMLVVDQVEIGNSDDNERIGR